MIGAGIALQDGPFKATETDALPLPIISVKQDALYVKGPEIGLNFASPVGQIIPGIDLFVAARATSGKDRRKITADAGLRTAIETNFGTLSGEIRHDITGKFNGAEIIARYSVSLRSGRFTLTPALQASWLDRKTADHMYGITAAQREKMIAKNRSVIPPVAPITDNALNLTSDLSVNFRLNDKLSLLGFFSNTYLGKSIRRSPAIDTKCELQAMVGIVYQF